MDLMTIDEVAEMLHASEGTIRHWRSTRPEGYPVGFRIGKRVVYDRLEILAFVDRQRAAEMVS